ncbi:MAG: general secretion pathway protein GspD, partial [Planctomycetaceae bacterium]|nr:general secretion pathway protein GspD [Planctomycetaceae bacterium]
LIKQLDRIPDAETQIKVFTVTNGDANELLTTLQNVFGSDQTQAGGVGGQSTNANLPLQTSSATAGASLINLRFGVDARTNSIIASGPAGDLQLIEDLLNRLDEQDLSNRINHVFKLSNAPAEDVALAINNWLDGRQEVFDADPTANAEYVAARRQVVVVEELISNSLIISATPAYYEEVISLIEQLDRRPPMVKIKVMLAQVRLDKLTEFGVEVGIQDSLLFDRGLGVIGFPFNQAGIGNNADALSLSTREMLAGQALSSLKVGRENTNLGYGGMVLSAGNESINVLLRALQNREVARVLSTPDIMTVENLQGRVQVGQKVPRITGAGQTDFGGIFNEVSDEDVGVILSVTPRVSPDGMIIMSVDAVNSKLGSEADGVPVFVSEGQIVRSPPIWN